MNERRKETPKQPIENPFEKVTVEQFNDDYSLIAYLFAKPEQAIYNKLVGRENYIIVGGWGSGKTMLLKYLAVETQIEDEDVGIEGVKRSDFIGVYIKPGRGPFKPFLKPGGEFKESGENLFGHYFNLLILERILLVVIYLKDKRVFDITSEEETKFSEKVSNRFLPVHVDSQIGFGPQTTVEISSLLILKNKVASYRYEIETFLNTRDLEEDISYQTQLSIHPTNIKTFLDETIKDIKEIVGDISRKRFYLLLDECEQFSKGQQKVINTLIKQRLTTLVFKLATRPPDIQTRETIDKGIGLTDRECKHLYLDREYDPTSASFKKLCRDVARKRLEKYGYAITDIRKILGKHAVEDEIGEVNIISHLKEKYPTKERVKNKFEEVYKDFKMAAAFQIVSKKRLEKKYAGFDTFVMLSSGIMVHFLELCRDTFNISFGKQKHIIHGKSGKIPFGKLPLLIKIQDIAAKNISENFYRDIKGRAESLKDAPIDIEFGDKIRYMVSVLGGIFREKLMSFNEPEAARIEIPEGISSLDNNLENPVRQIFEDAIKISVFQEGEPYMPKRKGGIRPPTYILNRILAPYLSISPRPRWRTKIPAEVFNKILTVSDNEFKGEVFGRRKKKEKVEEIKKEISPVKKQLTLQFFSNSESMSVLAYLSNKIKSEPFKEKTLLVLLHFLTDLIPFIGACKKAGASQGDTIIFYKDYLYSKKEGIKEILKKNGYKVCSITEMDSVLKEMTSNKPIIVIEDGGHIVPRLHMEDFKKLGNVTLGAVEQTTRGIRNDQQVKKLLFPVISIPDSKLKDTFEPPHVARAVINNIQKLMSNVNFSVRKALVIGYGSIGEQIVLFLRDSLKMSVSVYELDATRLVKARQQGVTTEKNLVDGVKDKFLIVGATGETVVGRSEILAMDHNIYLVSASSEQWEFCISELDALCSKKEDFVSNGEKIGTRYKIRNTEKYINLVADGYPINFWKSESMPNEVSDLIMSLIFISAIKIATNLLLPKEINSEITNKLVEEYEISKIYLEYHK